MVSLVRLPHDRPLEPFWEQTVAGAVGRPELRPLDSFPEVMEGVQPTGFIFHMTRCGSTLISRAFASLPQHRVLSEPGAFQSLLRQPGMGAAERSRWLRKLMVAHAWGVGAAGKPLFVKWHSGINRFVRFIEWVYPSVPKLFLTRDPVEVLVSCLEGPPRGWEALGRKDFALPLRVSSERLFERLSRPERTARYVGSFCHWARGSRRLRLLDYSRLPAAIWTDLPAYFGITLTDAEAAGMRHTARLYSKDPAWERAFVRDTRRKQERAGEEVRELAARFIEPYLARLHNRHPEL